MGAAGCSESFLDQEPENVIPESMIYEDKELVLSVLSNLYGKVNWGQNNGDYGSYDQLDEAIHNQNILFYILLLYYLNI